MSSFFITPNKMIHILWFYSGTLPSWFESKLVQTRQEHVET